MTGCLQENATPEVAQELDRLEKQADKCEFGLRIYSYPFSTAVRAVLAQSILSIEEAIEKFGIGSQRHREVMINLSNAVVTALGWVNKHCDHSGKRSWRWNKRLADAALEIQNTAHSYSSFLSNFPMWHKNRIAAELVGQNYIRFSSVAGSEQLRIRAYQQGARIPEWPTTIDEPIGRDFVSNSEITPLIADLLPQCRQTGFLGFTYPEPFNLWIQLNTIYLERLTAISRWQGTLQLNGYSMAQFRRFYAALLALCGVHEFICYFWANKINRYPVNSALLARKKAEWIDTLVRISGLDQKIVASAIADLTVGRIRPLNLYVHPFIPG
ncbi:MAG: hypothetical protein LAP21_21310, partial [Acidobacteriia bacterium]|nr:hypothetical protein [Terriglobia bacterium]